MNNYSMNNYSMNNYNRAKILRLLLFFALLVFMAVIIGTSGAMFNIAPLVILAKPLMVITMVGGGVTVPIIPILLIVLAIALMIVTKYIAGSKGTELSTGHQKNLQGIRDVWGIYQCLDILNATKFMYEQTLAAHCHNKENMFV